MSTELEWHSLASGPKDGTRVLLSSGNKMADGFYNPEYRVWVWPYVLIEPRYWAQLPEIDEVYP